MPRPNVVSIHQLQMFVLVAEHKSSSKAAVKLDLSQAAASVALRNFQNNCPQVLFMRHYELTEYGRGVYAQARILVDQYHDMLKTIKTK